MLPRPIPYVLQGDTKRYDATFKLDVTEATSDTEETVLSYRAQLINAMLELDPRCDGRWWRTGAQYHSWASCGLLSTTLRSANSLV